jgi:hypothetical protein
MILTKEQIESMLRFDRVPSGTYFSPSHDPEVQRKAVAKWTIELGAEIATKHPEIADMYRNKQNPRTYLDIAKVCVPELAEVYPAVASKAVGHAVRRLIPEQEQFELTAFHRRLNLEDKIIGDRLSDEWRKICRDAWKKRHEMYGTDVEAMVRGRGQVLWTEDEKNLLWELADNPDYQHHSGSIKGTPHYELIALELNIRFHDCIEIRTNKSVGNYVRDLRRQEKKKVS